MADGTVQIAPSGTGQKIDMSQLVQDGGATVQRQRIAIGDAANVDNFAKVDSFGRLQTASPNVTSVHSNPSVSGSNSVVLASNSNAKYRFIQNTTATPAWMKVDGTAATVGTGMFIGPYGSYEMSSAIGNLDSRQVSAISTSGTIAFAVLEGT